ncbi:MAG TPA: acyloxyacyl hydrolase [Alphaproteobacteria bacterium]|nr:acyloxyacyl hydrolase [Alphaproteobacteria bacterium]HAJ47386.1 acyloxyacyl hydrolase [Alphaproteobacteria bacterium]
MRLSGWRLSALAALILATSAQAAEIRLGITDHDTGIFGNRKEQGFNVNGEVLFNDLGWIGPAWPVRPHAGVSINSRGDTSLAYGGLTVQRKLGSGFFLELGAGAAVHTGELKTSDPDRKELGSRVLIHASASAGIDISDHASVSVYLAHASNAGLADRNEGINMVGVRVGYRF